MWAATRSDDPSRLGADVRTQCATGTTWRGEPGSRCTCGKGAPSNGAKVVAVVPRPTADVSGRGEPSTGLTRVTGTSSVCACVPTSTPSQGLGIANSRSFSLVANVAAYRCGAHRPLAPAALPTSARNVGTLQNHSKVRRASFQFEVRFESVVGVTRELQTAVRAQMPLSKLMHSARTWRTGMRFHGRYRLQESARPVSRSYCLLRPPADIPELMMPGPSAAMAAAARRILFAAF